jgi:hypothetical protein
MQSEVREGSSQRSQLEDIQHSKPLDPLRMIERQAVGDATTTIMPREAGKPSFPLQRSCLAPQLVSHKAHDRWWRRDSRCGHSREGQRRRQ